MVASGSDEGLKVVSFSLWGSEATYLQGAEANVILARKFYPGWQCWFWVDQTVPVETRELLSSQPDCKVIFQDSGLMDVDRLAWRFMSICDPSVEVMISRDADSRISEREVIAVEEWLASGKQFHIMRDHPRHGVYMLGGMWGCRKGSVENMPDLLDRYYRDSYGGFSAVANDQDFLYKEIWPIARQDYVVHDPYFENKPFPDNTKEVKDYVGKPFYPSNPEWEKYTPRLIPEYPPFDADPSLASSNESFQEKSRFKENTHSEGKWLVLYLNGFFNNKIDLDRFETDAVTFSQDPDDLYLADCVVIHTPELYKIDHALPPKMLGQHFASWSMESKANYAQIDHPYFDFRITYQADADIWVPYLSGYVDLFLKGLNQNLLDKPPENKIAAFISSDTNKSRRKEYIEELGKHIEVHHYGKFNRNRTLQEDLGGRTKLETYARYKFCLAFENSVCDDYVTEKFFDPLIAGSIPVYYGAENIYEFSPHRDAFVNVRDFESPKDLAAHLNILCNDEELYRQKHAWKKEPYHLFFKKRLQQLKSFSPYVIRLRDLVQEKITPKNKIILRNTGLWKMDTFDNKKVLVQRRQRKMIELNEISQAIFDMCLNKASVDEILTQLSGLYPDQEKTARKDIMVSLTKLHRQKVICRY